MCDPEASSPLLPCHAAAYRALTLETLRPYVSDPFWVKIRSATLFSLVVAMIAMLSVASIGVYHATPCAVRVRRGIEGPIYRVEADAFFDVSGSGRGDLKGITSKLDYLAELGVKIIWLSPIYKSPMNDFGYDIEDFREVDEVFGTMEEFKELVAGLKKRGMKLVMDLVPNHTSDKHIWFQKSIDKVEPYTNYYVWVSPSKYDENGKPLPPNNWLSVFGGSAWEFNEKRKQFYLHQFVKEQPDLNFRNGKVLEEMLAIIRFWLDLGVRGFRVDAVAHLFEDPQLRDEPLKHNSDPSTFGEGAESYLSLSHIHTFGLPEVMDVMQAFRECIEEYSSDSDGKSRLLMAEVYDSVEETMKYYGNKSQPLADFPFNFLFITNLNSASTAQDVMDVINLWMINMPQGMDANWVLGNHDQKRVASRLGQELVDGMHMISLLLPGMAITYYGEEIGMEDTPIPWTETVDPMARNAGENNYTKFTRDPARTPMQWNGDRNSGFSSSNRTWLPINNNYVKLNVEAQKEGKSHLNVYKALVKARHSPAIKFGDLDMKVLNDSVFAFTRSHPKSPSYLVAVNWSNNVTEVDLTAFENMTEDATIYVQSVNSTRNEKSIKDVHAVKMEPKEGLVLTYKPATV